MPHEPCRTTGYPGVSPRVTARFGDATTHARWALGPRRVGGAQSGHMSTSTSRERRQTHDNQLTHLSAAQRLSPLVRQRDGIPLRRRVPHGTACCRTLRELTPASVPSGGYHLPRARYAPARPRSGRGCGLGSGIAGKCRILRIPLVVATDLPGRVRSACGARPQLVCRSCPLLCLGSATKKTVWFGDAYACAGLVKAVYGQLLSVPITLYGALAVRTPICSLRLALDVRRPVARPVLVS